MKKFLLAAIIIISSLHSYAQGSGIKVSNMSSCTVYFTLLISTAANPCGAPNITSTVVAIPAGVTTYYSSTTYPGYVPGSPYEYFFAARVYATAPYLNCAYPAYDVGEPCTGMPTTMPAVWNDINCNFCSNGSVFWAASAFLGGNVGLNFY